jgi:phage terminase large subunit-like protein
MVEIGPSSILKIARPHECPLYEPSKRRLVFPSGAIATTFSGDAPDQLRGPQFDTVWIDELAKFQYPDETWDNMEFGLRLGDNPQVFVTTTPRPIKIIKILIKDPRTIDVRFSTFDNAENLSTQYLRRIQEKYAGTRLGRQELEGEVLEDNPNALWTRELIENLRLPDSDILPPLIRVVVGVDPAVSEGEESAEIGIIASGISAYGHGYVLQDSSLSGSAAEWARAVIRSYHHNQADRVIGEVNNGGYLVEVNLRTVDKNIPYSPVHASRGKEIRAEPVSSLYEQGKIHHVGVFPELEDQMCEWEPGHKSPDRMDAMVWAFWELFGLGEKETKRTIYQIEDTYAV